MSGVEAAASLFGSEESGSDLFATLGTESTSPHQSSDALFSSNGSTMPPETESFEFSSQPESYTSQPPDFSQYPTYSAVTEDLTMSDNVQYGSNTRDHIEQWGEHEPNNLRSDYSKYAASQTTTSSYNAFVPPTYSSPTTAYSTPTTTYPAPAIAHSGSTAIYPAPTTAYSPSTTYPAPTTTYSTYGAYDPPTTSSSYTPYAPNSHTYVPPIQSYSPATTAPSTSTPSYNTGSASIPPVPTPAKTTLTRPKVSNAYDPPFLQTLPNRKPPRSASSGTQMYAQYQSHTPSSYTQSSEASSAYIQYQQQPSISHTDYRNSSADSPLNAFSRDAKHAQPNVAQQLYSQNGYSQVAPTDGTHTKYSAEIEQQSHSPGDIFGGNFPKDGVSVATSGHHYAPEVNAIGYHNNEYGSEFSITQNSMHGNTQGSSERPSVDEPTLSKTVSPRSIPLSFSPPTQKEEVQDHEGVLVNNEYTNRLNPQHKSPPQQSSRREFSTNRDTHDPYAPKTNQNANNYIPRTSSPLSISSGRPNGRKTPVSSSHNISPYSSVPRPLVGIPPPAVPLSIPTDGSGVRQTPHWSDGKLATQDIIVKATSAQYAPSPSLIGANDPLSRTSARAPVVTFGFGGKMVTCFHGMPGQNAGFDVALSSRTTSELKIHVLQKFLPESALNSPGPSYPGPLLADPGTSSISLVRPGQTTQTKTKKAGVLSYLSGRASEIHQGLGYFANTERQVAEDKLILVKLLSIMIENDGRLLGTPQSDSAVRSTLVPRLEGTAILQDGASLQATFNPAPLDEVPISVTTLRPSVLDKIEEHLLQGDRRQAYQFAMDQKLWAHAMIIASSIDKESWKDVVNDFLRTELGSKEDAARKTFGGLNQSLPSSRDSLRVAYSLYSGQGAAAVQELAPINLLQRTSGRLQPPMLPTLTPRTPNFPSIQPNIPAESLSKWAETAAMIISSPLTPEVSGALTALGDQLLASNWVEAAHSCYLLSSQTSSFGGLGNPSARIILIGSKNPGDPLKDSDTIVLSEILEFALSLIPIIKGHEPFHGLPHLQAYKFLRAVSLSEIGEIQLANRYCEAITSSLAPTSPHTTVALIEQLQGLQQRISGVFHGEKGSSWIGGKLSKPSLDTIGGWLEGRFTKLVTGDADEPTPTAENAKSTGQPFAGPFAHYSTISSTTPSARSSPQPSFANLSALAPQRTTSAMATSTPYSEVQIERASSAMGYVRQKPTTQTSKDNAGSISSSQSSPTGYGVNGQSRYDDPYTPKYGTNTTVADEAETPVQGGASWWSSNDDNGISNSTPTATTFMSVDDSSIQASSDGFISLMDSHSYSVGPQHVKQQSSTSSQRTIEEEDDDLGLGNSKPKPKKEETEQPEDEVQSSPTQAAAPAPAKTADAPASSGGSWLGRWWKKSESTTPAPIKASLGEESAFYYDKDLKRWVNKKASADEAPKPSAPPPPPSRAQTASPGRTGSKPQLAAGPPARSASAIDLSTEPPTKVPMRIRSNLAPPTESAPSTPTGTRMNTTGMPPPGRPKSSAAKRNIRSRYVDVFQQEGGGAT